MMLREINQARLQATTASVKKAMAPNQKPHELRSHHVFDLSKDSFFTVSSRLAVETMRMRLKLGQMLDVAEKCRYLTGI